MSEITIKCYTEKEQRYHESQMKRYGYKRTHCSLWANIYEKENSTVTLIREW